MRTFDSGALRNDDHDKVDFEGYLSPFALEAFGKYMLKHSFLENGTKRDSSNWRLGIPQEQYLKSLWRHLVAAWKLHHTACPCPLDHSRWKEEMIESLCGVIFNSSGYLHEITKP